MSVIIIVTRRMKNIEGAKPDGAIALHVLSDIII